MYTPSTRSYISNFIVLHSICYKWACMHKRPHCTFVKEEKKKLLSHIIAVVSSKNFLCCMCTRRVHYPICFVIPFNLHLIIIYPSDSICYVYVWICWSKDWPNFMVQVLWIVSTPIKAILYNMHTVHIWMPLYMVWWG